MEYKDLPEELVRLVTPLDARTYAAAAGWQPLEGVNGTVAVYHHPSSDLDQLVVPLDAHGDTYGRRMAEVIAHLAEKEDRPAREVLDELLLPPADVLRLRVATPEAARGTLPLEEGIQLMRGGRDLLLAAACSTHQPQAHH